MATERQPLHAPAAFDGSLLAVGTMSGTSMDGVIDAALVRTDGDGLLHRLAGHPFQYEDPTGDRAFHHLMKAAELAMRESRGALDRAMAVFPEVAVRHLDATLGERTRDGGQAFARFSRQLFGCCEASMAALIQRSTDLHIAAVRALLRQGNTDVSELDLIGYHGQTLYHGPQMGLSVQVGDAQRIADACGRPVVGAFREADLRAGGQGAPLAPVYHHALAQTLGVAPCVFVNLGGCSNVTVVGTHLSELMAFDAGPGNTLLDRFVNRRTGQPMDRGGRFALRGTVDAGTLEALERRSILRDGRNYLDLRPPKSLDVRDPVLVRELDALSLEDGCATLAAFTATCVARAVEQLLAARILVPTRWIISGGGARNRAIVKELERRVGRLLTGPVRMSDASVFGLSSAAMEAELVAFLAVRSHRRLPITFPGTTGVSGPQCGGRTYHPSSARQRSRKPTSSPRLGNSPDRRDPPRQLETGRP